MDQWTGSQWETDEDGQPVAAAQTPRVRRHRFHYGLQEVAALLGLSYEATKKAVQRKKFNPKSLQSIAHYWRELEVRRASKLAKVEANLEALGPLAFKGSAPLEHGLLFPAPLFPGKLLNLTPTELAEMDFKAANGNNGSSDGTPPKAGT